ncbi:MAG TPA: GreA/GreB family elongation factor [Rhizomicrobium sp.]|nr:GreA/GreB family elongation factor [Rhizomicrobium sp.]
MSRAFVKETASSAPPPERMVEDGPNLVTQAGFEQILGHVARIEGALKSETNVLLRETLERDLRYWALKKASAEIVAAPSDGTVAFGSKVSVERSLPNGRRVQSFRIVGVDEADPAKGLISFRSPLAAALIGARAGDIVEAEKPLGEIEVISVEN